MRVENDYVFFWGDKPFSNFTPCPNLNYLGINWKSTEQAFMWIKAVEFKDYKTAQKIRDAKTPQEAKRLGRQVKPFDAEHWSKVSYRHMRQLVDIKFRTNPEFMKVLLSPVFEGKKFVEASPYDKIWGIGYSAENALKVYQSQWGENKLGNILTALRNQYKKEFNSYANAATKNS